MSAVTFATDHVIRGISNCSNTKAFGHDKLSMFHLKNLGPKAIEYLTALFNDSVTSLSICKSSIVIPKPGKDSSLGTSYRPISLLCPAAKVMEALMLTTVNTHLLPACDQHGFRPGHSTTSALLQLMSDVATSFHEREPPHRRICVAVDLTADSIQSTITYCYQSLQDQRFLRQSFDGCRTTSEADNQLQAAKASSPRQG